MVMIASLLCGLLFGAGLLISGMVQPTKVLGFLDVFGAWDPSLAVVMIAALVVSRPGFMLARRHPRPILVTQSFWPTKIGLDRSLVIGSALFGVGWGLVGLCPGPAFEGIASLTPAVIAFVAAMGACILLHALRQRSRPTIRREAALTSTDG